MGSFPQNKVVYDSIRKRWVSATPEEVVRQNLIFCMVTNLQYPSHSIVVEKKISEIVKGYNLPNRRIDVLCFETVTFKPLLLIECKSVPINTNMLDQLIGYNQSIRAKSIYLTNQKSNILLCNGNICDVKFLPSYLELIDICI